MDAYIESIIKGNGMGIRESGVVTWLYMSVVMVTQSAILVPAYQFSIWLGHEEEYKKKQRKMKGTTIFLSGFAEIKHRRHWILPKSQYI